MPVRALIHFDGADGSTAYAEQLGGVLGTIGSGDTLPPVFNFPSEAPLAGSGYVSLGVGTTSLSLSPAAFSYAAGFPDGPRNWTFEFWYMHVGGNSGVQTILCVGDPASDHLKLTYDNTAEKLVVSTHTYQDGDITLDTSGTIPALVTGQGYFIRVGLLGGKPALQVGSVSTEAATPLAYGLPYPSPVFIGSSVNFGSGAAEGRVRGSLAELRYSDDALVGTQPAAERFPDAVDPKPNAAVLVSQALRGHARNYEPPDAVVKVRQTAAVRLSVAYGTDVRATQRVRVTANCGALIKGSVAAVQRQQAGATLSAGNSCAAVQAGKTTVRGVTSVGAVKAVSSTRCTAAARTTGGGRVTARQAFSASAAVTAYTSAKVSVRAKAIVSVAGAYPVKAAVRGAAALRATAYGGKERKNRRCLVLHPHRGGFTTYTDFGFDRFFHDGGKTFGVRGASVFELGAPGAVRATVRTTKLNAGVLTNMQYAYLYGSVPPSTTMTAVAESGSSTGRSQHTSDGGQTLRSQFAKGLRSVYWQVEATIESDAAWSIREITPLLSSGERRIGK